jgi:hypothetical protein
MTQSEPRRYPFKSADSRFGEASLRPMLPLNLRYKQRSLEAEGLLDTGAMVNVLPYQLGTELGAQWDEQTVPVRLTGNLAQYEARVLLLSATVEMFPTVQLAFVWTQSPEAPLLLGQVNFFLEFDVCFYRSQLAFEVRPKIAAPR